MGWFSKKLPRPVEPDVCYEPKEVEEPPELSNVKRDVSNALSQMEYNVTALEILFGKRGGEDMARRVIGEKKCETG